jgi:hypothetical protein
MCGPLQVGREGWQAAANVSGTDNKIIKATSAIEHECGVDQLDKALAT